MKNRDVSQLDVSQCLFGYGDGHRLLASSIELSPEVEHYLLEISDLDPNADGDEDGYWTGIPLKEMRSYALMKTWPAPEMPRPGCVWTHAILIRFSDMAQIESFDAIARHAKRPARIGDYRDYSRTLSVDTSSVETLAHPQDLPSCMHGISALYSEKSKGMLEISPKESEHLLFSLWSQQWPRLRRSFRFRTTQVMSPSERGTLVFDLSLTKTKQISEISTLGESYDEWVRVAAHDILFHADGSFRRFLWRYGSDVRQGLKRFRFLAQLYIDKSKELTTEDMFSLLDSVARELPSPDDGQLLKKDLLAMGESSYSMLPVLDPLHLMSYLANKPGASAFPLLPESAFSLVSSLWHQRAEEILVLADQAIASHSLFGDRLVERLALLADPSTFLQISAHLPKVRARLVELHPELLDSPHLLQIHSSELIELLSALPDDNDDLATRVIGRLLSSYSTEVASFFKSRFSRALQRIMRATIVKLGSLRGIPQNWISVAQLRTADELRTAVQDASRSSADLAACVLLANSNLEIANQIPVNFWTHAVTSSRDDVSGDARLKYLAFLFALALDRAEQGCEPLFEKSFEEVHAAVWRSRLPYYSFEAIARRLPNLPFWQQWDSCLRLRMAVVRAYKVGGLDMSSFSRLAKDPMLKTMLKDCRDQD